MNDYEALACVYIMVSFCMGMMAVGIIISIMEWIERKKRNGKRK